MQYLRATRKAHTVTTQLSCAAPMRFLRTALAASTTICAMISLASGQSIGDFVLSSPGPIVQLMQVEQLPSNNYHFTFRNISNRTILEICISAPAGPHEMVCMSGFANGAKLPGPGDTFDMTFDHRGFTSSDASGQPPQSTLRINAVIYTDGSHSGESKMLATLANRMVGTALETKRTSDLLSNCPNGSVVGLDNVLPQIGTSPPLSSSEAAEALRSTSLPGMSPVVINSYLNSHGQGFLEGVTNARDIALDKIGKEKALASMPLAGSKDRQQRISSAKSSGVSELAQKYQSLSQAQIGYLVSFLGGPNAQ